jgi:hypothetical protein
VQVEVEDDSNSDLMATSTKPLSLGAPAAVAQYGNYDEERTSFVDGERTSFVDGDRNCFVDGERTSFID